MSRVNHWELSMTDEDRARVQARDDEFVEKIHKLVNGWAVLMSQHQIRAVLAALAHLEGKESKW